MALSYCTLSRIVGNRSMMFHRLFFAFPVANVSSIGMRQQCQR